MTDETNASLSHLNADGSAHMVDVGQKPITNRVAIAAGEVVMLPETLTQVQAGNLKKGDVLGTARLAGIMAAKRTAELIPLCHPLPLSYIDVQFDFDAALPGVKITAEVRTTAQTGVEMEALTAVSVAALTIYDMTKAIEKTMKIQNVRLTQKTGGQSGEVLNA